MTAYTISNSAGNVITTINDGTTDSTTDLVLLGKNYTGYGGFVAENFVYLLENFAKNTAPTKPITGQLWYCKDSASASSGLNVYDGTRFIPLPRYFKADTAPTPAIDGDLWWDRTNKQLFGYNGTAWNLIGPSGTTSQGKTGMYSEDIYDVSNNLHTVLSLYVKNSRVYINSLDAEFTPNANASATGFTTIKPGINANANVQSGNIRFAGIATGADNATTVGVSSLTESQLMRKDITQTMTEGLIIGDSTVGLTLSGALTVNSTVSNMVVKNTSPSKKLTIQNHLGIASIVIHESSNYVGIFKNNPTKALDVTGDAGVSGSLTAAGTLIANATGVFSNGGQTWTQSSLTNLSQLTNDPGYLTSVDLSYLNITGGIGYVPVRQSGNTIVRLGWNVDELEAYQTVTNKGALAFKSDVAGGYLGRIKGIWQTSSDGRNRILFSDNAATIFGSHTSTYLWKDTANTTIATLTSNGNLNLGSGTAWTTSGGPNPLTNLDQLTNGPGYLTAADFTGSNVTSQLGYIPARQSGASNVTFQWYGANLEAKSNSTVIGNIAFSSNVAAEYLGRISGTWQTSSDNRNRILFSTNGATIFGSHNSTYLWKDTANTTIATLTSNGNLNLGSGTAWTTSGGPNPLTTVSQLSNDTNFIPQDGSTTSNVKFRWNSTDLEAYSGATNAGALAFKSDVASLYLGRTKAVWQTSSDTKNRLLFIDNSETVFGSAASGYIWKSSANASIATLSNTGVFTATNDVVAFSDAKLKANVKTIENALNTIQQLRGVTFTRLDDNRNSLGVIAQEVQSVLPEVVTDSDGTLGVAYGNMVGVLIEAIKEQQDQINELQNQIRNLGIK